MANFINRLFPPQIDSRARGSRIAWWLLLLFISLKLVMSINSIFNAEAVAVGADKIPIDSYGPAAAEEVLTLFRLVGLDQLALTLVALIALVRYRQLIPFAALLFLAEHLARRLIVTGNLFPAQLSAAYLVNVGLMAILALVAVLALTDKQARSAA